MRTFEECRQKAHLQRAWKNAPLADTRVFFAGTVTDRVVRDWLLGDPLETIGAMPDMVSDIIDREMEIIKAEGGVMRWKSVEDREQVSADCRKAVELIEPALLKYVVPYSYTPDYRFKIPVKFPHPDGGKEIVFINGAMDIKVYDPEKDRFTVFDVKHTKDDSYWRKVEGQLTFYDLAVLLEDKKKTQAVALLQPLCKVQVRGFKITDQKRSELLQRIGAMAYDTWRGDKAPRVDNKMCGFCNVKHACEKFAPVMVAGKKRVAF